MTKTKNDSPLYREGVLIPNGKYLGYWEHRAVQFIAGDSYYVFQTEDFISGRVAVYVTVKNDVFEVETMEK